MRTKERKKEKKERKKETKTRKKNKYRRGTIDAFSSGFILYLICILSSLFDIFNFKDEIKFNNMAFYVTYL